MCWRFYFGTSLWERMFGINRAFWISAQEHRSFIYRTRHLITAPAKRNDSFNLPDSNQRQEGVEAVMAGPGAADQGSELGYRRGPPQIPSWCSSFSAVPPSSLFLMFFLRPPLRSGSKSPTKAHTPAPVALHVIYNVLRGWVFQNFLNTTEEDLLIFFCHQSLEKHHPCRDFIKIHIPRSAILEMRWTLFQPLS